MLIFVNLNLPAMCPHNFPHHRKSKAHASKLPAS